MKRLLLLGAGVLLLAADAAAQQSSRIFRTEVLPYDTRHDAEKRDTARSSYRIALNPKVLLQNSGLTLCGAEVEIPYRWTDGIVFLHLENRGAACTLSVNDRPVATLLDPATPAELELSGCLREGPNQIRLLLFSDAATQRINPATDTVGNPFEGSYLYYQNKLSISDFRIALVPDSTRRFGILELDILARNAFNYDEPITVGYDIYSPDGKLLEFNIFETTLAGRSTDTLRFRPFIYHTYDYPWTPSASRRPPLYRVMLFTKRNKACKEYMPLRIGFAPTEYRDGKWYCLGNEWTPRPVRYNAAADRDTAASQLAALRKKGYNTIRPDRPQPEWFYDLCDEEGLRVIDRAAIDAPEARDQRSVGGTPSNDPTLADEYLERVKAMYYRSRNHTCILAYALGLPSGNGYNLYKAYEWLKSVEPSRPILCEDADGEWNSDL